MRSRPHAKRLDETDRRIVHLQIDGIEIEALEGDTVLTAVLLSTGQTGTDVFNQSDEAGFCLMGACQSCWIWTSCGGHLRACDMAVEDGLKLFTKPNGLDR